MAGLLRAQSLSKALAMLSEHASTGAAIAPIAGGTDVYPAHVGRPISAKLLDLSGLDELHGMSVVVLDGRRFLRIGAMTRWSDILRQSHDVLKGPAFQALVMCAAEVGGVQIQNRGTIGGNLCNASPAADGVPPLQALDAQVVLSRLSGSRRLPITDFITGPRNTALAPDELLESVLVPFCDDGQQHSVFLKLGHRRYLVISVIMLAARLVWSRSGTVISAGLSVGSCGPFAVRLTALEQQLVGLNAAQVAALVAEPLSADLLKPLSPIDDMRGTAQYRLHSASVLACRALNRLSERPGEAVVTRLQSESS